MKRNIHNLFTLFIIISLLQVSCMSYKRSAVSCPDFSKTNKFEARNSYKNRSTNKKLAWKGFHIKTKKGDYLFTEREVNNPESIKSSYEIDEKLTPVQAYLTDNHKLSIILNNSSFIVSGSEENTEKKLDLTEKVANDNGCDIIILKNGVEIEARDIVTSEKVINYKLCDVDENTVLGIDKTEVFMIKYADGSKKVISPVNQQESLKPKKTEALGLTGLITSLIGLWIMGIPLGILSIIFGSISLGKIKENPSKYNNKGLALAAVVLGFIDVIGVLLILMI